MRLGAAVTAVTRVFRRRPSDLLPFYVLGAATPVITRVIAFVSLGLTYLYLETTGRLDSVRTELDGIDRTAPDPETDPAAFEVWVEDLVGVLEPIVTPGVLAIVLATFAASVLVSVVLYAVVSAGQLAACFGRLRDERGLVAGIEGVRRHWRSFLGLYVLEFLLWVVATVALLVVVGLTEVAGGSLAAVLVGLVAGILWFVTVLTVRAVFAFATVAIVVDRVGVFAAVSNAAGFVRHRPIEAGFYYLVAIVALVGFGVVTTMLTLVGVVSIVSLVSLLVIVPVLDLLKTALYGGSRNAISPPPVSERSRRSQIASGLRRGWKDMLRFVRSTPGLHVLSTGAILVGFAMGWIAAEPYVGVASTSIEARLETLTPVRGSLELFGNNWTVALTTAFGGVAAGIPALASLWFNGLSIGALARLEVAPLELLAFIVPHGVVEIPAILVAGAAGLYLGRAWWRTWRGPRDRVDLADAFERTFWVLVGIGILLAIAAVIEGFVSPYYYGVVL